MIAQLQVEKRPPLGEQAQEYAVALPCGQGRDIRLQHPFQHALVGASLEGEALEIGR